MSPRAIFYVVCGSVVALVAGLCTIWPGAVWLTPLPLTLMGLGLYDMLQTKHALRRNFPIAARLRYVFEAIRPEMQQYFVESNSSGRPFSRQQRSLVYQRAKNVTDTLPFGTEEDVYAVGYEWMNHSLCALHPSDEAPRVRIGGPACAEPYDAAVLNVSAMSYGALSRNAILALNRGAKLGGFYHNTGEGGLSPYHLEGGGDICWQVGTGYFGCRDELGNFDPVRFADKAKNPQIKLIELKLSQGAKPGHGGILPAAKVTREIAEIRHVAMGKDVLSPPTHSAFDTPEGLCRFLGRLRELSGGKPIGFKLCLGKRREFLAICKAMLSTGIAPDFISVDGGEGGTGAAPLEFSNVLGTPLDEALIFIHNALVGVGLRQQIRVIGSGRVISGFDLAHKIAIGADLCNSARAMMFALGCIQAQRCNTNNCPTGVATQDPALVRGLVVEDKAVRVRNYQHNTVRALMELLAASGMKSPAELRPWHILRRVSPTDVRHYGEMYEYLKDRALLGDAVPKSFVRAWNAAKASSFESATPETN